MQFFLLPDGTLLYLPVFMLTGEVDMLKLMPVEADAAPTGVVSEVSWCV